MAYSYVYTEKAEHDLNRILDYIANHLFNEIAAKSFFHELDEKLDLLCDFPELAPVIKNRFIDFFEIRRLVVKRYFLYYYVDKERQQIVILSIRHSLEDQDRIIKDL